jgi:hypothetical protein
MRKLTLLTLLALVIAVPASAERERHQSYFSYDDGGTVVRQPDDDRDIEARINLPVYPGDEVITNRRGRSEIRLADGNVLGIDRATAVRFRSILDSYEGDADETVIELRYGKVIVYRAEDTDEALRVDTPNGTYYASDEAVFSVEADSRGHDRVAVLDGNIEVRTPSRTTRLREGEQAQVDDRGLYDFVTDATYSADDFETWFLRRAEKHGRRDSRYLDRTISYYDDDLLEHGSWTYISGYGYGWRPRVSVGWRPYYHGYWARSRYGTLTWVSYEPWGWAPYHYGRWSYDPFYGWFWLPGAGYGPAWVYWWYGPGYVGWAPSGFYDCYRPYYNWAYNPYRRAGLTFGFGFYGRVRVGEIDLRPWTFVDGNSIHSNRVDRAALTTDAIRSRLARDGDVATISGAPARFTREEYRDPAAAINRRWKGVEGNLGTRSPADMTPFFRRDNDLTGEVRDRIVRSRPADGAVAAGTTRGGSTGSIGRGTTLAPTDRTATPSSGVTDRINRGGATRGETGAGRVTRGGETSTPTPAATPTPAWRGRVVARERGEEPAKETPRAEPAPSNDAWRGRAIRGRQPQSGEDTPATPRSSETSPSADRSNDVPRRVIDRIGGARLRRGDEGSSSDSGDRPSTRSRSESPRPSSADRPRSSGGSRESSSPRSVDRSPSRESSPPRASSGGSDRSSSSGSSGSSGRSSGGSSRGDGGSSRVKRD